MDMQRLEDDKILSELALALGVKQTAFCEGLLSGNNISTAYSEAGYTSKTPHVPANKLMKTPNFKAYMTKRYSMLRHETDISLTEVRATAREIVDSSMVKIPILDSNDNETGRYKIDANGAAKGNDQLIRLAGLDKAATGMNTMIQFDIHIPTSSELPISVNNLELEAKALLL